ncbi:GTP 3',8-cyclase MoaA [Niabella soli]|uniref:GTP 3',8-cyclase n=1 Tax=Niabella soli DSM 19437 TaxID=929713 RepID=W0EZU4_9BACT|nr:GTP 3',8-cyclase MoaA [Niabella soli]AHF16320.1 molybdenum cofactor biosynthesis protein MoeA [Niabella soli DSM 19437]
MLIDQHNRVHNYLRISLTDHCNFRCLYCMPEGYDSFTPPQRLMQADEIVRIAQTFVQLGVNKIRLTGGEPLVRKDAGTIIKSLGQLPAALTLTTNGALLDVFADALQQSGVSSVNISLDTLDADKFRMITRRNSFNRVMNNIRLMLSSNMKVKINVVIIKGVNEQEVNDFVAWTKTEPVHVRFIEFMPFDGNRWNGNKVVTWKDILDAVSTRFVFNELPHTKHETAKAYQVPGHTGSFSVITTMSAPFCSDCNRIRLTADGKLKNCLFSQSETDLLTPLRNGEALVPLIEQSIYKKAKALGGQFDDFHQLEAEALHNRSMIAIGG